jgi:hypothetical protein
LEGIEDSDSESVDILDGQPPMSILINAECNFLKSQQKLSGGSVFLENLSHTVSNYAQGLLSGLPQPSKNSTEYPQISLTQIEAQNLHRLTFEPEPGSAESKTEVDLTTVELFDLVDAIDQFYLDRTALPDMTLELQSVSKRYRQPEQPLAERVTPVIIGFASLAMAAAAFFVIPPPEIRPPKPTPANETSKPEPAKTPSTPPTTNTNSGESK